jgi:hypothetical protein
MLLEVGLAQNRKLITVGLNDITSNLRRRVASQRINLTLRYNTSTMHLCNDPILHNILLHIDEPVGQALRHLSCACGAPRHQLPPFPVSRVRDTINVSEEEVFNGGQSRISSENHLLLVTEKASKD